LDGEPPRIVIDGSVVVVKSTPGDRGPRLDFALVTYSCGDRRNSDLAIAAVEACALAALVLVVVG
jgi:hypothetical protein